MGAAGARQPASQKHALRFFNPAIPQSPNPAIPQSHNPPIPQSRNPEISILKSWNPEILEWRWAYHSRMRLFAATLALAAFPLIQPPGPTWTPLASGVTARLRGVSAVSDRVAWASGAGGTVLRTIDGGGSWQRLQIPGSDKLDFRDIDAIDDNVAYVLSIGPGEASKNALASRLTNCSLHVTPASVVL